MKNWRAKTTKGLLIGGLVGFPLLLWLGLSVAPLKAALGGAALAVVPPIVFVVFVDLLDQMRFLSRQAKARKASRSTADGKGPGT